MSIEKVIYRKYAGRGKRFFCGEFVMVRKGEYVMRINERLMSETRVVEKKNQSRIKEIDALKPGKSIKGSQARKEHQELIDDYLKRNKISVLDATKEVTVKSGKGKSAKETSVRTIENDLGFEVEYFLREERVNEEIEIERLSTNEKMKKLVDVPMFCKVQAYQFRFAFHNYLDNELVKK